MKVNYGVNSREKQGRRWNHLHKNGKLNLPQYTDADWENDDVRQEIRRIIMNKHPRWSITGYGLSPPAKPQRHKKTKATK